METFATLGWLGLTLALTGWFGWLTWRLVALISRDGYGLSTSRLPGEVGRGELPSTPYVLTPPR